MKHTAKILLLAMLLTLASCGETGEHGYHGGIRRQHHCRTGGGSLR